LDCLIIDDELIQKHPLISKANVPACSRQGEFTIYGADYADILEVTVATKPISRDYRGLSAGYDKIVYIKAFWHRSRSGCSRQSDSSGECFIADIRDF
jgi:hypothetical protein